MKKIMVVSFLCLVIASCVGKQVIIATVSENTSLASIATIQQSLTVLPYPTFTPVVTATPVYFESDAQDLGPIIHDIYKGHSECKSGNALNPQQDVLEFFDVTKDDYKNLMTTEIAESADGKYRANLTLDIKMQLQNCETGCDPSRIYIENLTTGQMQGVNWAGYMPKRATWNLVWIGNNILAFKQSINNFNFEIIAIDIQRRDIVYRSLVSCN